MVNVLIDNQGKIVTTNSYLITLNVSNGVIVNNIEYRKMIDGTLTNATIPDNTTSICDYAFYGRRLLREVTIPNSVTSIGNNAFESTNLSNVDISNTVTNIGNNAFANCSNLELICIDQNYGSITGSPWGANDATIIWRDKGPGLEDWRYETLSNGTNLLYEYLGTKKNIYVPSENTVINNFTLWEVGSSNTPFYWNENVISVDLRYVPFRYDDMNEAFFNCPNLVSVSHINQNVTNMFLAFSTCSNLVNIPEIPNSVVDMSGAFGGCHKLVNAPDLSNCINLVNMSGTFAQCINLVNAPVIPNSVTDISQIFYNCTNLVNVPEIPNSVTNMSNTFCACTNLNEETINIPNSVTDMSYTFAQCTNLINAPVIPNSVTNMYGAFLNCPNLNEESINIPNSVTDMGCTFINCKSLVNAPVIPNSVTNMAYIFQNCTNLVNISKISINAINLEGAFSLCTNLVSVPNIPNSVTDMNDTFLNCTNLKGEIYIYSEQISNAQSCFSMTSLNKDVFIPFTYENGVYTATYNAFIEAGYSESVRVDGVLLKDGNATYEDTIDLTDYSYVINDDKVTITKYNGNDTILELPIITKG